MREKYREIIRKIAESEGVSESFVYAEMKKAINSGYNNPDPDVQEKWRRIAPDGKIPPPEKFIEILTKEIKKR